MNLTRTIIIDNDMDTVDVLAECLELKNIQILGKGSITTEQIQTLLEKDGVETCLRKPVQLRELVATITV